MSMIRLYLDEDSQDQSLLKALRARNIDVITAKETQTEGLIDVEQLRRLPKIIQSGNKSGQSWNSLPTRLLKRWKAN